MSRNTKLQPGHQKFCPCANAKGREHNEPPGATNQNTTQHRRDLHVHLPKSKRYYAQRGGPAPSFTPWKPQGHDGPCSGARARHSRFKRSRQQQNSDQRLPTSVGAQETPVFSTCYNHRAEKFIFPSPTPAHGNAQRSLGTLIDTLPPLLRK